MFTIYVSILEWNPAFLILYHTNQTACKSVENSVSCDAFHASIGSVYVSTDDGITRHQSTNTQQGASTTRCGLRARRYRRASKHNSVSIDITGIESESQQLEWAAAVSAVLFVDISMCWSFQVSAQGTTVHLQLKERSLPHCKAYHCEWTASLIVGLLRTEH